MNSAALSRRRLLTATGALGLGGLLTACGGGGKSDSPGDGGTWSFKDDRGKVIKTDKAPKNLVAFISTAAALHDYGVTCTGVFGPSKPVGGKPNPQAGDLDVDKLTSLGNAWGEFNIEKYATLQPDLLISNMFPPPALWFVPEGSVKKIEAL
ncbi:ABC transporter substrate-binding protein, partial [Streptomyces sp. NPDC055078]